MIFLCDDSYVSDIAMLEQALFDHPWNEDQIREHLRCGNNIWVENDGAGAIRGYLIASSVAGEWEIYRIAVELASRRMGIARNLLDMLFTTAAPGETIFLEVRLDNLAAQHFYLSNGFLECGRRAKYYHDGEDAVIMMKSL